MIFKETQKFTQIWIWFLLAGVGLITIGVFGFGVYKQIFLGQKYGNNPMSDTGLIITFCFVLLVNISLFLLFGLARMTTVIDKMGIRYQFTPFHLTPRFIYWNMIEKYEVVKYDPIKDYGGWGIKINKHGKAYTFSGINGLLIHLKSGKRILLGTQKDSELTAFLSKIKQ
jgi:hypothetical protein